MPFAGAGEFTDAFFSIRAPLPNHQKKTHRRPIGSH
jgi:hypothetical protein